MRVDTRWVNGNGYRPVRVELQTASGKPAPAERRFQVVLSHSEFRRGREQKLLEVSGELVLPQGRALAATSIALPQWNVINTLDIEVYENGDLLGELSQQLGGTGGGLGAPWTEASPATLAVSSELRPFRRRLSGAQALEPNAQHPLPRLDQVLRCLPGTQGSLLTQPPIPPTGDLNVLATRLFSVLQQTPQAEIISPVDLPQRWIELSAVDLIFISWQDVQGLIDRQPQRWQALCRWTAAGHTLCVSGMEGNDARRDELARQMATLGNRSADAGPLPTWRLPNRNDYGKSFREAEDLLRNQFDLPVDPMQQVGIVPIAAFQLADYQLGTVVAFDSDEPARDASQILWMLNSLEPIDWAWFLRYGMSLNRANSDFHNWPIPGVGQPPIVMFLVLLSGFSILIGPVNYFSLRRRKRLYLLLVTVPAAALVTTILLLLYGIVSDGIGVRIRSRSYTRLDQAAGQQVTWSRQTYYAGLRPSRGLVFDESTLVMPIDPLSKAYRQNNAPVSYVLDWNQAQVLRSGYLQAREPAQLMVVQAAPQPARITLHNGDGHLTARNEIGGTIRHLVVRDVVGQWFHAENVAAGAQAALQPLDPNTAALLLADAVPELPLPTASYYYADWGTVDNEVAAPQAKTSVLETNLARVSDANVEPGSFVAVMAESADWLPTGVKSARQVASLHVIEGRLTAEPGGAHAEE